LDLFFFFSPLFSLDFPGCEPFEVAWSFPHPLFLCSVTLCPTVCSVSFFFPFADPPASCLRRVKSTPPRSFPGPNQIFGPLAVCPPAALRSAPLCSLLSLCFCFWANRVGCWLIPIVPVVPDLWVLRASGGLRTQIPVAPPRATATVGDTQGM
jgi:hypothetical protein